MFMEVLDEERGLQAPRAPAILSPCSSGRRRSSDTNSPEFEFWSMMRNPNSFPESNFLSADELFSDGVMLPLDQLHLSSGPEPQGLGPEPEANGDVDRVAPADALPSLTSSKRWRDIIIFRKHDDAKETAGKKKNGLGSAVKESKRRESKMSANGGGGAAKASAAELKINIWPFSRSRSAGNGGARPRAAAAGGGRKVSSAPCSRSNSGGEAKTRKWPSSPARMNGGVHLGRTSPVWQVRRGGGSAAASVQNVGEKGPAKKTDGGVEGRRKVTSAAGAAGKRVLSLNVPMCMGYSRSHLSCRSDENSAVSVAVSSVGSSGGGGGVVAGEGVRGSNMFGIRGLFTKKVY